MPLQRYRYRVEIADPTHPDGTTIDVEVTHADLLRAELEANKHGLPVDPRKIPMQTTTLWVWASLVRTRVIDVDYRTFRDGNPQLEQPPTLIGLEQIKGDDGTAATVDVDPMSREADSPSLSLPDSATSGDGLTPTPTNA